MAWLTCVSCRYVQLPAESCRRCGAALPPPSHIAQSASPGRGRRFPAIAAVAGTGAVLAGLLTVFVLSRGRPAAQPATPTPVAAAGTLDLSGTWSVQISKDLPASPPRPALKEIVIESDRDGSIIGARVVLTDPGRGGAGAGYRVVGDGKSRLDRVLAAVAGPRARGAPLDLDFVVFPGWVAKRERLWKILEGAGSRQAPDAVRYVVLESVEDDYLIQAGVNASGFLSYAYFSRAYAPGRGRDFLSTVIHPAPGSSLRGFRDLVWDLSGSTDFLSLAIDAEVSGPENGAADHITLRRGA